MVELLSAHQIRCFLKHKNVTNAKIMNFKQSLEVHILELKIALLSIDYLTTDQLHRFDALVGDCKCQTRTSMILDLSEKHTFITKAIFEEQSEIQKKLIHAESLLEQITSSNYDAGKNIKNTLKDLSIHDFFVEHNLIINVSSDLNLASLCLLTALSKQKILEIVPFKVSSNKICEILLSAKKALCELSIEYEQMLAKQYGCQAEQSILNQIEAKYDYAMTPFFPSFMVKLKKIKRKQQLLFLKITTFCLCGGTTKENHLLFKYENNKLSMLPVKQNTDKRVMVLDSYQFQGSFEELKQVLSVPPLSADIPKKFQKECICKVPQVSEEVNTQKLEKYILAVFAQHPQFTTDADVKFEEFNAASCDLYEKYLESQKVEGCNIEDIRNLHIFHVYPSTVGHTLHHENTVLRM